MCIPTAQVGIVIGGHVVPPDPQAYPPPDMPSATHVGADGQDPELGE